MDILFFFFFFFLPCYLDRQTEVCFFFFPPPSSTSPLLMFPLSFNLKNITRILLYLCLLAQRHGLCFLVHRDLLLPNRTQPNRRRYPHSWPCVPLMRDLWVLPAEGIGFGLTSLHTSSPKEPVISVSVHRILVFYLHSHWETSHRINTMF